MNSAAKAAEERARFAFDSIRQADEVWSSDVQAGKVPFVADTAREIHAKYIAWLIHWCFHLPDSTIKFRERFFLASTLMLTDVEDIIAGMNECPEEGPYATGLGL